MSTPKRLVDMILRGKNSQFNTVLSEELRERASILMEKLYREETKKLLEYATQVVATPIVQIKEEVQQTEITHIEARYELKDGNIGVLAESDRKLVSELYKNLNNENKERMVKLLSESQETFNRVLNLARLENKKGSKNG
jgi:Holliday junction resolvase